MFMEIAPAAINTHTSPQSGLTQEEARQRLDAFGPNTVPDTGVPLQILLEKFGAPISWGRPAFNPLANIASFRLCERVALRPTRRDARGHAVLK